MRLFTLPFWRKYFKKFKILFFWEGNRIMEKQIFNASLIIAFFYMNTILFFNVIIRNWVLMVLSLAVIIILCVCFYLLRVKNNYKLAYFLFGISGFLLLSIGFYFNDGIDGPTFYILLFFHLIMMSISPNRKYIMWTAANGVVSLTMFYVGIFHREWIPKNYDSLESIFLDHSLTYLVSLVVISFLVYTFKTFYKLQKNKVKEKSAEMVLLNRSLSKTSTQKDKIITIISHDLKNPLQSIMQTLELINQGELPKEDIDYLHEELLKITTRTYNMMENILDWSSFEIKNQQVQIRETDMRSLIEDTVEILKVIGKQKGVEITVSYIKNPSIKLETDRVLLILRNLVQNAIKFTESDGKVSVEIDAEEEEVILTVMDNGVGISKERLDKIFDLDIKSTYGTALEKGTGMGLHLCIQNAKKLGGDIQVVSNEGEGSTFILRIPDGKLKWANSP